MGQVNELSTKFWM